MTYRDLYVKACRLVDSGEITLGEFLVMTLPLDREIEERKKGHWEIKKASIHPYGNDVACSECGYTMGSSFGYKFCPMCGCKMEVEE